jgi:hypothetical protein
VRTHVALEVEVGEFIGFLEFKKGGKFGVRVNLATVLLVLKIVVIALNRRITRPV